ncbi:hypothetical protein WMF28_24505 [Sorangium sp. So ce590]|uniref:hypothetical protein n=1 Tax=Sorangium sp. So ce590 TaxID=3133317 RepID=UPI003F5FEBB2
MDHLIRKIAQDRLWNQWVAANSVDESTLEAGYISKKEGCISKKEGCISKKEGCISEKAGCIS